MFIHKQFSLNMFIIVTRLIVLAAETWCVFESKHTLPLLYKTYRVHVQLQ